jgi:uroporphyrinogen-III synthase
MNSAVKAALQGKRLWLTRPAAQLQDIQQQLQQLGAHTTCLPLLHIEPVMPSGVHKQRLLDLDRYDLVFFVSSNAAQYGMDAINDYWPQYPLGIRNYAVGPGTAKVLQRYGLSVEFPTERMSSEAMLALPSLQNIDGMKALIVRGVGGREILAEGLLAKGASVDYVELYQRQQPLYDQAYLLQLFEQQRPDAVIVSSAEALENLKQLFAPLLLWTQLPLVVSSPRLAEHALHLGKRVLTIIEGASDAAIIAGLSQHFAGSRA